MEGTNLQGSTPKPHTCKADATPQSPFPDFSMIWDHPHSFPASITNAILQIHDQRFQACKSVEGLLNNGVKGRAKPVYSLPALIHLPPLSESGWADAGQTAQEALWVLN